MSIQLKFTALTLAVACTGAGFSMGSKAASNQHHHIPSSQSHAPIGVMGDHMHKKGEWMFSYRYMYMDMQGNQDGDDNLSPEDVVTFTNSNQPGPPVLRVVPTKMTMEMHMLGGMYAPSDTVTIMLMTNFVRKEMDHITFQGMMGENRLGQFTTKSDGIGDTSISALLRLNKKVHATLGLSLPTGSIDEKDQVLTPMNTETDLRLPYPMQLGSGTYDLIVGATLNEYVGRWAYGAQFRVTIRTGENDEGYTVGDEMRASSWLSYALSDSFSLNSRIAYFNRGNIEGSDDEITAPVQTADPSRQGLDRIDLKVGFNWLAADNKNRVAFEVGAPVYQKLDGPQLETDLLATVGWQYAF